MARINKNQNADLSEKKSYNEGEIDSDITNWFFLNFLNVDYKFW